MKNYKWPIFFSISLALTVSFCIGFAIAYKDVINPPRQAVKTPKNEVAKVTPGNLYVALGDSLTRGVGASNGEGFVTVVGKALKKQQIVDRYQNLGIRGFRAEDLLKQLNQKEVIRTLKEAKVISITIGGNNLFDGGNVFDQYSEEKALQLLKLEQAKMEEIFQKTREINPEAIIIYTGLYNPFKESSHGISFDTIIQKWNAACRILGVKHNIQVVDTFNLVVNGSRDLSSDQFHPNDSTYKQIAENVLETVMKRLVD